MRSESPSRRSRTARFAFVTCAALAGGCAPTPPTSSPAPVVRAIERGKLLESTPLRLRVETAGGYAASADADGVPTFVWSASRAAPPSPITHAGAALFHAARFAPALALSPEALAAALPAHVFDHGAGGTVVQLRQRVGGVEVWGRELRLLMRTDHSLVALSGRLHPSTTLVDGGIFRRPPEAVLAGALGHATGAAVAPAALVPRPRAAGEADTDDTTIYEMAAVADAGLVEMPHGALVRKVLFPEGAQLRPAYQVEFYAAPAGSGEAPAWRYIVAADESGEVLQRVSLTQYEAFTYRVWATPDDFRPLDGPIGDWTPHPTGKADWSMPPFIAPSLVTLEGFNTKTPSGNPDPWLPATATETFGNNVDAHTDRRAPDGLGGGDFRARVNGPRTFDRVYDVYKEPLASNDQAMAAVTQAFYNTNWLHDYWYDSGFDESAGNAQGDNLGRGGRGNDRLLVQTQDNVLGGSRDNSNQSTPSDGLAPRMQLFVWSGSETRTLHSSSPDGSSPDADHLSQGASFGPEKFERSGELVNVDDRAFPSPTDACQPIVNMDEVKDKIALIDRGTCTFKRKAVNAVAAGAIGVVIVNNVDGDAPRLGNGEPMATIIDIPVLSTTKQEGIKLRAALERGPVMIEMSRVRDIDRDGGLESLVTFHEWGHYIHHRLARCDSTAQCSAMSEGWGDFIALHSSARPGDNLDGTNAAAIYASAAFDDPAYFGIRRQPYSVDFRKDGLTFKHIADDEELPPRQLRNFGGQNSEVHNAGEVWATMMWEAYVALQKAGEARGRTFDETRRRMADYVVAGLQMTPAEATYTEQRDAVLAAAGANDPDDQTVLAEAFARRGAGTCADSPARSSEDFKGVVEGYTVQPRLTIGEVNLTDEAGDCNDGDGVLDSGERAKIVINVTNGALAPLAGARVKLRTTTKGISFTGPEEFEVPDLDPYESAKLTTEVTLDPKAPNPGRFELTVEPSEEAACANVMRVVAWPINSDVHPESTARDDVEQATVWEITGDQGRSIWSRELIGENRLWNGGNAARVTDTAIVSPELLVSPTQFFVVRFEHRHYFETMDTNNVRSYFDGGVVELSEDGGETWTDVSEWVTPGYGAKLAEDTGNPLAGRNAFVDRSFSYPKLDRVTLNFLDSFAGKTVRIRFRIGTDAGFREIGPTGWDIDNISFQGIQNTPFADVGFDSGMCGEGPRGPAANPGEGGCSVATGSARHAGTGAWAMLMSLAGLLAWRRRRPRSSR